MGNNSVPCATHGEKSVCSLIYFYSLIIVLLLALLPVGAAFATSAIANQVAAFCAPEPTVPDVGSCSACHSTTNNRGPDDLTAAGMWSVSQATYSNFCPAVNNPPPVPDPTPTPEPPGTPPGSPGSPPPPTGMGMGSGGDLDDDDDDDDDGGNSSASDGDDDDADDDDDGGSAVQRIRNRLSALRNRLSRSFSR